MRAMLLRAPGDVSDATPLAMADLPMPEPAAGEVVIRVRCCGVCRTDLDLARGRLAPPRLPVVPGHQIVGVVSAVGADVRDRHEGDRVGAAWIRWACGECRWCRSGLENLCPRFQANGCDANGGYAEYVALPAAFTFPLPASVDDSHAAPLLCAGAIGWRSLRLAGIRDGDPLGLTGFGASAHLVLQVARRRYASSSICVFARSAEERAFARELGASWVGDTSERPPFDLAAIIDTTPAWKPVVEALPRLRPGGRLVINAIRKANADRGELARIEYEKSLWMEREIKSVANVTRADVRELLDFASGAALRPTVEVRPLREANVALARLGAGQGVRGATVLRVDDAR
jgi:propanol-preferring alcohol dehydrogenase